MRYCTSAHGRAARRFIDATNAAVATSNWYAALALALTMPDICAKLEAPGEKSQKRYMAWYDKFLLERYQRAIGADHQLHTFLSAADCYALRCAYLHQGEFGIEDQRARQVLQRIHFTAPRQPILRHRNERNQVLQLEVGQFCIDVCNAVQQWLNLVKGDADIQARMAKLATID